MHGMQPQTLVPSHEHGPHTHEHSTEAERRGRLGHGFPVLDIGGDIGALVLYTTPDLEGAEIEVSPTTDLDHRTHTQVLRRDVNGRRFWAGVYVELPAGDYRVWYDDPSRDLSVTITGGQVAQLDWR